MRLSKKRKNNANKRYTLRGGMQMTQKEWDEKTLHEQLTLILKNPDKEVENRIVRVKSIKFYYCIENDAFNKSVAKLLEHLSNKDFIKKDINREYNPDGIETYIRSIFIRLPDLVRCKYNKRSDYLVELEEKVTKLRKWIEESNTNSDTNSDRITLIEECKSFIDEFRSKQKHYGEFKNNLTSDEIDVSKLITDEDEKRAGVLSRLTFKYIFNKNVNNLVQRKQKAEVAEMEESRRGDSRFGPGIKMKPGINGKSFITDVNHPQDKVPYYTVNDLYGLREGLNRMKKMLQSEENQRERLHDTYRSFQLRIPGLLETAKRIKNGIFSKISSQVGLPYTVAKPTFTNNEGRVMVIEDYRNKLLKEIDKCRDKIYQLKINIYKTEQAIDPIVEYEPKQVDTCPCCNRPYEFIDS